MTVPIISKNQEVEIKLTTQEISAIVQAIFLISEKWTPTDVETMKSILEKKETLSDPRQITFVLLDRIYRKLLKKAQEEGKCEDTEVQIPSPLETTSNPLIR